jgi:hypothetical protein
VSSLTKKEAQKDKEGEKHERGMGGWKEPKRFAILLKQFRLSLRQERFCWLGFREQATLLF